VSTDVVVHGSAELAPSTLFGTDNPGEVVERAAKVAQTLADLVRRQNLVVRIGQSDHVRVEGWTTLGAMLGVFPVVEWTRPVMQEEQQVGWEARVVARTRAGETVGAAEAECLRSERTWKGRDDYALRSMAQTRAVSKALRLPLGFVMQLAGFDPTPADEMPVVEGRAAHSEPLEDVPFGDVPPEVPVVSEPQKKKLDVLVKSTLKDHVTTEHLYEAIAAGRHWTLEELVSVVGGRKPEGSLSWGRLRDALLKHEATGLIDRLEKFAQRVGAE